MNRNMKYTFVFLLFFLALSLSGKLIAFEYKLRIKDKWVPSSSIYLPFNGEDATCSNNYNCTEPHFSMNHTFACSDGAGDWNNGILSFFDPLPPFSSTNAYIVSYVTFFYQLKKKSGKSRYEFQDVFHVREHLL